MAKADYRSVVEACYRAAPSDDVWCTGFIDALTPLVPDGASVGLVIFTLRGRDFLVGSHALTRMPDPVQGLATVVPRSLDATVEGHVLYEKSPLNLVTSALPRMGAHARAEVRTRLAASDAVDLLGVLGYPDSDVVAALAMLVRSPDQLTPRTRAALARVRMHMELGLRHRLPSARPPVAVLRADGQLVHLTQGLDAPGSEALAQLGHHVRAVERIRCSRFAGDSFDALMLWDALVAGRWSTREQIDADGRRHYLVFENPTAAHQHRALTAQESETLRLYAAGKSGKEVAAALAQAPSTVSERLGAIADKLGLRTRDDVLRLYARANADREAAAWMPLTSAERDVLADVVGGKRDDEIARARRTSVHTVRKQVASLRHKLRAPTRSQLASRART